MCAPPRHRLRPSFLLLVALAIAPMAQGQDVIDCNFAGIDPALNTPWTQTSFLAAGLSYSGWTHGPGATAAAGVNDALGFSVNAGATISDLAAALAGQHYLSFTLTPTGTLDLGGRRAQVTTRRIDWHAPRTYALFSSVDGFALGQELFRTPTAAHGDTDDLDGSFIFPLTGYDGLTGPVEFRLYAFDAQYAGHRTSLRDFAIVDPGPVASFALQAGPGGSASSAPAGGLVPVGQSVLVHAAPDPGYRFVGWTGDLVGVGNPRTVVVAAPTSITATFEPKTTPSMELGTNLPSVVDWATAWIFVDQMKLAREWLTRSVGGTEWDSMFGLEVPLDGDGWPTQLPFTASDGQQHYVHTLMPVPEAGQYTVIVEGTGVIQVGHPVNSGSINLAGGTTTLTANVPAGQTGSLLFEVHVSDPADPVRNLRVIRPGFLTSYQTQPFHPLFLSRLDRFTNLRFMDMGRTNGQGLVTWANRTPPGHYTQASSRGAALEVMIDLANTLSADPWFCIPHQADDSYVTRCARLLRDNVDPALKIHVEYSNETWNGIFSQTGYVNGQGLAAGLATTAHAAGQYFHARRSARIWEIFEQEFVDDTRIVKVLAGWAANSNTTGLRLAGVVDPAVNPSGVMPDVIAIAPYFGVVYSPADIPPAAPAYPTVLDIFQTVIPAEFAQVRGHVQAHRALADAHGLGLVCYEAGQHFVGASGAENDTTLTGILQAANRDSRMQLAYTTYLDLLRAEGASLTSHFSYCGSWSKWGSWGALEYQDQPLAAAPKHSALEEWRPLVLAANTAQLAVGAPLTANFTLTGGAGHAGRAYLIVAGVSGSFPGTMLPGGDTVLVNVDALTLAIIAQLSSPAFLGFLGTLDTTGTASAQMSFSLTVPPALAGMRIEFAYLLLNPIQGVSNTISILFGT